MKDVYAAACRPVCFTTVSATRLLAAGLDHPPEPPPVQLAVASPRSGHANTRTARAAIIGTWGFSGGCQRHSSYRWGATRRLVMAALLLALTLQGAALVAVLNARRLSGFEAYQAVLAARKVPLPADAAKNNYRHTTHSDEHVDSRHWAPPTDKDSHALPVPDSYGHCDGHTDHSANAAAGGPGSYNSLPMELPQSSACPPLQSENWETCRSCLGSGRCSVCQGDGRLSSCSNCQGSGRCYFAPNSLAFNDLAAACSRCRGSGSHDGGTCPDCNGTGRDATGTSSTYEMDYRTCIKCQGSGREPCYGCGGCGSCLNCVAGRAYSGSEFCNRGDPNLVGDSHATVRCSRCRGTGTVVQTFVAPPGLDPITQVYTDICPQCLGYGMVCATTGEPTVPFEVQNETCYHCRGSGNVVFLIDLDGVAHSFTCPVCSGSGVQSYRVPLRR